MKGDSKYNSSDIASVIQEVVSRAGWSSGNSIALFWEDFSNVSSIYHEGYSYDGDSSKAAKLYVYWDQLSIDSATATNPTDSSWWLCWYSYYTVEVNVTDPNGVADLNYVDLKMETPADTYSNAIIRWTEANNSFFIQAGAGYIALGSSIKTTDGNRAILDFKFTEDWDYPLTTDVDCQIYAVDDSANSVGPTKFDLNLALSNSLTTTPSSSDYRQDVSGSVVISGTIIYVGPPQQRPISERRHKRKRRQST